MTRVAYLAYPIDANPSRTSLNLVEYLKMKLHELQLVGLVFDPGDAFTVFNPRLLGNKSGLIQSINGVAAGSADVVFAFLPQGVDTIGVPMEIDRAAQSGKEVWLFSDRPVMFMIPQSVRQFDLSERGIDEGLAAFANTARSELAADPEVEPLPFKLLHELAVLPTRAHATDAGFDLHTVGFHTLHPGEFADIPTGVAVELPDYAWGNLVGRSSTWRKHELVVQQGIIDSGYRGPLFVGVQNPTNEEIEVAHGTRLAQLIVMSNVTRVFSPMEVQTLNGSERGERGFGSSGV